VYDAVPGDVHSTPPTAISMVLPKTGALDASHHPTRHARRRRLTSGGVLSGLHDTDRAVEARGGSGERCTYEGER
jgi:hypothetical protein